MNEDLEDMAMPRLKAEVKSLREVIRRHRDQRGHDRCHLDDLLLYSQLPEQQGFPDGVTDLTLPPKEEFLEGCQRFWELRKSGVSFNHCSLVEVVKERDTLLRSNESLREELDLFKKPILWILHQEKKVAEEIRIRRVGE